MKGKRIVIIGIIVMFFSGILIAGYYSSDETSDFDFGFIFNAGSAKVEFKDSDNYNELAFLMTGLRVNIDISDYLVMGIIAGYQQNHFNDSLNITVLPLSLKLPEENSNSMVLGFIIESEPFSVDDFALDINFEFNYFKSFKKRWDIKLPVIKGKAESTNSFYMAKLSFLLKYDGFSSITPFIGPNLSLISGKLVVYEEIIDIKENVDLHYKQKSIIGLTTGVRFEVGDNWDIVLNLNLFSEKSLSLSVMYVL